MTRVLFASWHWYLDQSNGASITTRETLLALARRGWDVKTFCGAATDFSAPLSVDEIRTSNGAAVGKRVDGGDVLKLAKKSGAKTVAWLYRLACRDGGRCCYVAS
ncbi:MAG: hypothetical protein IJ991_15165 [Thermoguttaceae bacterium]|nr:hypothetical protein [Thermoguttaceae bacterium]